MRRVVLVLADGLRPDAITPTDMPSLDALSRTYTTALRASTVRPSRTVAALASLATGVAPETHGLIEPGLGFLARLPTLRPLARELTRGGVASQVVASELLPAERAVLWALTKAAGLGKYRSAGLRAREVARAAQAVALTQSTGLVFVYLNDCDQAGHAHGWMSARYRAAAVEVDAAIGVLSDVTEHSLVIVMADHGGGGVSTHDHAEPHPTNDHIPLILAGRRHAASSAHASGLAARYPTHIAVVVWAGHPRELPRPRVDAGVYPYRAAARGHRLMRWLTHLGSARVTIGIGLLLVAVGERLLGLAALFALTTSHLAVQGLKRAVARPRPCDANGRLLALIDLPDPYSFPSGHAAAASAVGGTIALAHPPLAPILLPLAALIATSRVSLKVHHVGDVVAGLFLGLAGAVAAATLILR